MQFLMVSDRSQFRRFINSKRSRKGIWEHFLDWITLQCTAENWGRKKSGNSDFLNKLYLGDLSCQNLILTF